MWGSLLANMMSDPAPRRASAVQLVFNATLDTPMYWIRASAPWFLFLPDLAGSFPGPLACSERSLAILPYQ
jgi:hypothetical protein